MLLARNDIYGDDIFVETGLSLRFCPPKVSERLITSSPPQNPRYQEYGYTNGDGTHQSLTADKK